jgi:hypothetical protein
MGKRASALALGALFVLTCTPLLSADVAPLTEAKGGQIVNNGGYQLGPGTLLATEPILDNNTATFHTLVGQEGTGEDTGAWVKLKFQTPVFPQSLHFEAKVRSFDDPFWQSKLVLLSLLDDLISDHWLEVPISDESIHTISGDITATGNTFNGQTRSGVTLGDMVGPGNTFSFLLWAPYLAGLHEPSPQGLTLYDASLTYTVPEPHVAWACLPLLLALSRCRRNDEARQRR